MELPELDLQLPEKMMPMLTEKARYKVGRGGRGSGKTHSFGRIAIIRSMTTPTLFCCARILQNSIGDSVHRLLTDIIHEWKLEDYFTITNNRITNVFGSTFIFKGVQNNIGEIKSTEGINVFWLEEAQQTTKKAWRTITPTIREQDSEIWISYNPDLEEDFIEDLFINNCPPDTLLVNINYWDNNWFPDVLRKEMEHCKATNTEEYENIWCGEPLQISDAQVFKDKFIVEEFDPPPARECYQGRYFLGLDFGFSKDPMACNRMFIRDNRLYIDYEAHGVGIENDDMERFLVNAIPEVKKWQMYGDSSRPETINHLRRKGFNIDKCDKWTGSVEDGIAYIKGFDMVVIHPRCPHTASEFKKHSYKVDKNTEEILPKMVDKHNHHIDDIRYGLCKYIKTKVSVFDVLG